LLHLLAALLLLKLLTIFNEKFPSEAHKPTTVITIEHKTAEPPKPKPLTAPHPKVQTAPQVLPRPVIIPPHEIAAPHRAPRSVPKPVEAAPKYNDHRRLGVQQITEIQNRMAAAIAQDRAGINPVAVAPEPIATAKHYGGSFNGIAETFGSHHGLCDPVTDWKADGYDYYYVACNVKFSDGTMERQSVPWPVRFPPNDDPFNGTAHQEKPLAMPLPGWTLPAGVYVSKELREYAQDHGVTI
jgi:hypothetical protein